jgi:hypothetical protein
MLRQQLQPADAADRESRQLIAGEERSAPELYAHTQAVDARSAELDDLIGQALRGWLGKPTT